MACPKTRVVYPDTATRIEQPLTAIINKIDPDFAKDHRFDVAYRFGRRVFKEDSMAHGAYVTIGRPIATESGLIIGSMAADDPALVAVITSGPQDSPQNLFVQFNVVITPDVRARVLAEIDARFRSDNGFCDPFDDGTIYTGTGAGGANPGTVPSIAAIKTESGLLFRTEDGRTFLSQDPAPSVGVDFDGGPSFITTDQGYEIVTDQGGDLTVVKR